MDIAKLSLDELKDIKEKIIFEIAERMSKKDDFCSKILRLKELFSSFENEHIALEIESADLYLRFDFEQGIRIDFDELGTSSEFDVEEYNKYNYEQLYIYSNKHDNEIDNFYIPLDDEFEATTDVSILDDDIDEMRDYENIVLIIHTCDTNYIFTRLK